jgi:hypothetical protein
LGLRMRKCQEGGGLHSEELHGLYSTTDIPIRKSRRLRWAGHVARIGGEKTNACGVLVLKPE